MALLIGAVAIGKLQVPNDAPPAAGRKNPNAGKVSDKIEHFVVLFMENRTPDHFFACMDPPLANFDGVKDGHVIPMDPSDPSKGGATVSCATASYVCPGGPGYDMFAGKVKPGGNDAKYPYDAQSDDNAYAHGAHGTAVHLFGKHDLPVKHAIARNFSVFNNYHSSVPSFSTPNHLYAQSATSCGMDDNLVYNQCGGAKPTFPQRTIYDNMAEAKVKFGMYSNHTPHSADMNMEGVLRYPDSILGYPDFFAQAANGSLPAFSWVLPGTDPRTQGHPNDDHPCHDVALGERLVKDVYEALRAGPGWEKTLFLVTYDDAGGWYDHVVPPFEGIPADASSCVLRDGCNHPFDFKRLGSRVVSYIMSPWVPAGVIVGPPKHAPTNTSQWEHSAISATTVDLFGLPQHLTARDSWAGSFGELLTLSKPRTDTPLHLPEAPAPSVKASYHGCGSAEDVTRRQHRHVELWARLNGVPAPAGYEGMGFDKVQRWIEAQYRVWRHGDSREQVPTPYDDDGFGVDKQPQLGTLAIDEERDESDDGDDDRGDDDGGDDDGDDDGAEERAAESLGSCYVPTPASDEANVA
jgi:phospholipase C